MGRSCRFHSGEQSHGSRSMMLTTLSLDQQAKMTRLYGNAPSRETPLPVRRTSRTAYCFRSSTRLARVDRSGHFHSSETRHEEFTFSLERTTSKVPYRSSLSKRLPCPQQTPTRSQNLYLSGSPTPIYIDFTPTSHSTCPLLFTTACEPSLSQQRALTLTHPMH